MATFTPSKKNITDFNGGEEYQNGSGLQAETLNNIIESQLYTQGLAKNAPNVTEANQEGTATVTIEQTADGTPRLKFANLKGATGEKGEKGDKGDAGSIANLDEVLAGSEAFAIKADKYIFVDTDNPVEIQSGMDLSGKTINIISYFENDDWLISFENGKNIGGMMGTFGIFSPSSIAEFIFWERGTWYNEQYTFPKEQGWTVTYVSWRTHDYVNVVEEKVVDCEYNYKAIQSMQGGKNLFRYDLMFDLIQANGMPLTCYGYCYSSNPDLIYDENGAYYSMQDAFNMGLIINYSGMVLNSSDFGMVIFSGNSNGSAIYYQSDGTTYIYKHQVNLASSRVRVDARTTIL